MVTPVAMEPLLGYHPCSTGFLTSSRDPAGGQCQVGSLTGAVASKGYRRRSKVPSEWSETIRPKSAKAEGSLTATPTGGAGTKVGLSDPVVLSDCHRSTDKSYPGDNRLITPKSSHRRSGLAPRCRLIASTGLEVGPKGWAVRPLKRYASWVQNVVRQFGPYPAWA